MQISEERLAARVRAAALQVEITKKIAEGGYTYEELFLALSATLASYSNQMLVDGTK